MAHCGPIGLAFFVEQSKFEDKKDFYKFAVDNKKEFKLKKFGADYLISSLNVKSLEFKYQEFLKRK